jgi:hypothetical protein
MRSSSRIAAPSSIADGVSTDTARPITFEIDTGTKGRKFNRSMNALSGVLIVSSSGRTVRTVRLVIGYPIEGGTGVPDYGVSGPTRRYALIVAMLVTLASAPTLIILAIGSASMNEAKPSTGPILGARPGSPVVVVPGSPDGPSEPTGGPSTGGSAAAHGSVGKGSIQRAAPGGPAAPAAPAAPAQRRASPAAPPARPAPTEVLPAPGGCGDGEEHGHGRRHRDRDRDRRHREHDRQEREHEDRDREHRGHGDPEHGRHGHGHRDHQHRGHRGAGGQG